MIGVYRNLSRTALDVEKSKAFLEMRKYRVQLYKSTILKPYFENIPTIDLGIFSGLITVKISSLVVSLYVFLRGKWRVIHLVLHPLVFWCISLYIHNTYTWNPNDTCFDWKRPCFRGVDLKKIEVIWLPGIYIYIHTPIYQYKIPHWCFVFFGNLPLSNWICRRRFRGHLWKLRLETSLLFWPSGGTFSFGKGENPNRRGPKRPDMMTTVLGVGEVEFSPEIHSMKLETSQNTSRLNLGTDVWFGKTRNIDNIYQRWRQQNEQCPARNVFFKGEQCPSRY